MICNIKGIRDYPDRGRCVGSRVIHAAVGSNNRGIYVSACNSRTYFSLSTGFEILKDRPAITCKSCLKVLEALSKQVSNIRYVLAHKKVGLYYSSSEGWVPDLNEATLYKNTKYIKGIIESYVYYKDGKIIDRWYWENGQRLLRMRGANHKHIASRFTKVRHEERDYRVIKVRRKIEIIEG